MEIVREISASLSDEQSRAVGLLRRAHDRGSAVRAPGAHSPGQPSVLQRRRGRVRVFRPDRPAGGVGALWSQGSLATLADRAGRRLRCGRRLGGGARPAAAHRDRTSRRRGVATVALRRMHSVGPVSTRDPHWGLRPRPNQHGCPPVRACPRAHNLARRRRSLGPSLRGTSRPTTPRRHRVPVASPANSRPPQHRRGRHPRAQSPPAGRLPPSPRRSPPPPAHPAATNPKPGQHGSRRTESKPLIRSSRSESDETTGPTALAPADSIQDRPASNSSRT